MEKETGVIDAVLEIYFKFLDVVCELFKIAGTPGQVVIIMVILICAIMGGVIAYVLIKNHLINGGK